MMTFKELADKFQAISNEAKGLTLGIICSSEGNHGFLQEQEPENGIRYLQRFIRLSNTAESKLGLNHRRSRSYPYLLPYNFIQRIKHHIEHKDPPLPQPENFIEHSAASIHIESWFNYLFDKQIDFLIKSPGGPVRSATRELNGQWKLECTIEDAAGESASILMALHNDYGSSDHRKELIKQFIEAYRNRDKLLVNGVRRIREDEFPDHPWLHRASRIGRFLHLKPEQVEYDGNIFSDQAVNLARQLIDLGLAHAHPSIQGLYLTEYTKEIKYFNERSVFQNLLDAETLRIFHQISKETIDLDEYLRQISTSPKELAASLIPENSDPDHELAKKPEQARANSERKAGRKKDHRKRNHYKTLLKDCYLSNPKGTSTLSRQYLYHEVDSIKVRYESFDDFCKEIDDAQSLFRKKENKEELEELKRECNEKINNRENEPNPVKRTN